MKNQSEIDDKYLKLAITLKTSELQRKQLSSLTYQHVERALLAKWKFQKPKSFYDAINDVMSIDASEVVAYLSTEAMITGAKMKLNDFEDLFGGDKR
ncbi:post-transcriptional regulator [[Eubacterium] hominis]|uniref:post-transcriptional regulator n=1 Tax=[Eubacterium] hominis TaxID=2764325 RepID=UPI003A4E4C75